MASQDKQKPKKTSQKSRWLMFIFSPLGIPQTFPQCLLWTLSWTLWSSYCWGLPDFVPLVFLKIATAMMATKNSEMMTSLIVSTITTSFYFLFKRDKSVIWTVLFSSFLFLSKLKVSPMSRQSPPKNTGKNRNNNLVMATPFGAIPSCVPWRNQLMTNLMQIIFSFVMGNIRLKRIWMLLRGNSKAYGKD